jgi:DNA (cytosine-5)-methyltransferase 1
MMRLLDLFCGGGGAAMGYHRAGFEIVGVDIMPQPRYPFKFVKADALMYAVAFGRQFDIIHASPPCLYHTRLQKIHQNKKGHRDHIKSTRNVLKWIRIPYVIENVPGARRELIDPIMLCGTMFSLETKDGNQLQRHRFFECPGLPLILTPPCRHLSGSMIGVHGGRQHPKRRKTVGVYGSSGGSSKRDSRKMFGMNARREVMQIDWMTRDELNQAIPPAYTEWLGKKMIEVGYV